MKNGIRTMLGILIVVAAVLSFSLAPASAAGVTQISGLGTPDAKGACTGVSNVGAMSMTGSLNGCWYTTTSVLKKGRLSGSYQYTGTETFVGCLSDGKTCGTFDTTYLFSAKYNTLTQAEIRGRCEHPIVSGTGGFANITGIVLMKDLPNGNSDYRGHIALP